jgi:photosystem II stability/assembly factor-like uncharacterized protein
MCRQTWFASLFALIVIGALLGGPLRAAAQTPAAVPTLAPGSVMDSVWGASPSDIFVVGSTPTDGGAILHYDGLTWAPMHSGTSHKLNSVWGTSSRDVFAVGNTGTILHYDGSTWSPVQSGTYNVLINIRGVSSGDMFVVGQNATILHYDGKAWSVMNDKWPVQPAPVHEDRGVGDVAPYLEGVWAASPTDVFAVGDFGLIMHYDGKAWSTMDSGVKVELPDVFGTSGSDVFAVGEGETILHYDGKSWSPVSIGASTKTLGTLWRTPEGDLFAAGDAGTIVHYDGKAWSPMGTVTNSDIYWLWGSSNDLYAVGSNPAAILHYDGKAWSTVSVAPY